MIFNGWIATEVSEVGISVFDFYSIGHICFGLGVFLFLSFFYVLPKHHGHEAWLPLWAIYLFTFGILILWEILENVVFIAIGIKFENRPDSIPNIISDLSLGAIAALINLFAARIIVDKDKMWAYYIPGIIAFILWLVIFFILRFFTL